LGLTGAATDAPVVIAGGSVAGLATALALSRLGREVTVIERDVLTDAGDADAAFAVERKGAPQTHQTHGFLARLTVVLRERFPDVLDALHRAGAETMTLTGSLGQPEPGDEDLNVLIVRRSTLEWVLRDAVRHQPGVTIRTDTSVQGLVAAGPTGPATPASVTTVPHVVGARLADGSVVEGTVVGCTGRRGAVPSWLSALGADLTEEESDTQIIYLTRWYRRAAEPGLDINPRLGGDFGYLKYLAIPCDGSTLSVTLAVRSTDTELRSLLLNPETFDRACRFLPGPDRFFADGASLEALGPVRPMGGLINRLRRFTAGDGSPLVTGFHAVGDAHTCTNPMYGRGCALAFVQATLLADAFADYPHDATARAVAYEAASAREVEPWFHSAVMMDAFGRRGADGDGGGANAAPDAFMAKFGALVADVMLGRDADPVLARGLLRMINTLIRPDELMADTAFMGGIASFFTAPDGGQAERDLRRISRGALLSAVAA
jgi:2-polyprenyl-6-methoxyphenol hydroxylase-like FAD-dependent oxidoreductase